MNSLPYIPLANTGCLWVYNPKNTKMHISSQYTHKHNTHSKGLIMVCSKASSWQLLESQHALLPGCKEDRERFLIKTTQMIEHKETQHGHTGNGHNGHTRKAERERDRDREREKRVPGERRYSRVHVKTHSLEWVELAEKTACVRRICLSLPKHMLFFFF